MSEPIQGLRDLNRRLNALGSKGAKKVVRSAARRGANIIKRAVQREIDAQGLVDTGFLRKSIRVRTRVTPDGALATVHNGDAFYGMFYEFGSSKTQAKPFMRPGFEQGSGESLASSGPFIHDGIVKEVRKR